MSKTQQEIQSLLGLTGNETLAELITVLNSYATVTDTELNNIKNISVQTLPTIVRNQEQLVKGRMTNPTINDTQGIPAVLNKRIVLIKLITDKMVTELTNAITKLNGISTGANKVEQSQTNGKIIIDGVEKTVYTLPKASANTVGGVKEGNGVDIAQDGTITVNKEEIGLEIVNNEVVQGLQNNKLGKVNTANVVYGTDAQGKQTTYGVSENVENNKIVKRTNTGKINLPNSVTLGQNTFATIEQLLDGIVAFVSNLSEEVGDLEGTDTSFTETVTALQDRVTELETSWTTFMAGTDADNITDTLLSVQTDIENLKTAVEDLENYDDTEVRGLITTETSRATTQENKSLYHLGAFDTVIGNTITRQTGYIDSEKLVNANWTYQDNYPRFYVELATLNLPQALVGDDYISCVCNKLVGVKVSTTMISGTDEIAVGGAYLFIRKTDVTSVADLKSWLAQNSLVIQYKLATAYTDTPIEGESILPLDSNMAQMIRQDVVEGLNLYNVAEDNGNKPLGTLPIGKYHLSFNITSASGTSVLIYSSISQSNIEFIQSQVGFVDVELNLTTIDKLTIVPNGNTISNIMLNKGSHPYPYEPYHASKHITDDEATLLKQEEEKCRNLLNLLNKSFTNYGVTVSTSSNGTITISGTANSSGSLFLPLKDLILNGTYTMKLNENTDINFSNIAIYFMQGYGEVFSFDGASPITIQTKIVNNTINTLQVYAVNGQTYNLTLKPMLNKGTEAKPYTENYGEIVHMKQLQEVKAKAEQVESDLANTNDDLTALQQQVNNYFADGTISYSISGTNSEVTAYATNVTNRLTKSGKIIFGSFKVSMDINVESGSGRNGFEVSLTLTLPSGFAVDTDCGITFTKAITIDEFGDVSSTFTKLSSTQYKITFTSSRFAYSNTADIDTTVDFRYITN